MRTVNCGACPVSTALDVRKALKGLQNPEPRSVAFPTSESVMAGPPGTVAFGDLTPGGSELDAPENAVQDAAMIRVGMTAFRIFGEMGLKGLPLDVCEVGSV